MELRDELRSKILEANDRPNRALPIPEWGCTVYIRTMSAGERDRYEAAHLANPYQDARARLAAETVCDELGNKLFTADDVAAISQKSCKALDRIFAAAMHHNGVTKDDIDELKKN
jgi:hypothetical protein